jgi:coenzyme F420-reducing hydrogenase delta subunit/ferredoxin
VMFEPRIIAFLCTWCSYTGADTAGINRLKIPANLLAVRVPCSGRVSPELVMRAFDEGADGVLVLGCHIGECHYDNGNHRAAKRLPVLASLLTFTGLEPERLRLDWVSASEGERFARITTEFTNKIREIGPSRWKTAGRPVKEVPSLQPVYAKCSPLPKEDYTPRVEALRAKARELLMSGGVSCVIGYEQNRRGRIRPAFIHSPIEVDRLTWNARCNQNLAGYLVEKQAQARCEKAEERRAVRTAVVVKPCDSRAINVLLAENQIQRESIFVIGMACTGQDDGEGRLQKRCEACLESSPLGADVIIGDGTASVSTRNLQVYRDAIAGLENAAPLERLEYWLSQFDRCIRCYACRQACPVCNCPTCLYERDDSVYLGPRIQLDEKRAFHLGRAYHLAGRCVGCNECERACPVGLPLSLLNQKLSAEVERAFGHRAGLDLSPSPIVTVLSGEYKEI